MDIFVCLLAGSLYSEATARSDLAVWRRFWPLGPWVKPCSSR